MIDVINNKSKPIFGRLIFNKIADLLWIIVFHLTIQPAVKMLGGIARSAVESWLEAEQAPVIIVIGTLDWFYPFQQRPHHLARALARQGCRVIYVSPGHGRDRILLAREVQPNILVTLHRDAVLGMAGSGHVYVASTDSRSLAAVAQAVRQAGGRLIYDYLDHLDATISNGPVDDAFRAVHRQIIGDESQALVVSSAEVLFDEVAQARAGRHALITNGVDIHHFTVSRDPDRLNGQMRRFVAHGQPVIGFFGALASWVDMGLMAAAARLRPDYRFVMLGPVLVSAPATIPDLPPNLEILDPVPYDQLPAQAAFFDVLTIPFFLNEVTAATSPLKLFEYMALGRPIVSSPIRECLKYDVVLTAGTPEQFALAVDEALRLARDSDYRARLADAAWQNSWDKKAIELRQLMSAQ